MEVRYCNMDTMSLFSSYLPKTSDVHKLQGKYRFWIFWLCDIAKNVKTEGCLLSSLNNSVVRINFTWNISHFLFEIKLLICFSKSNQSTGYKQTLPSMLTREEMFHFVLAHSSLRQLNGTMSGI